MRPPQDSAPRPARRGRDVRVALLFAALMLAIPVWAPALARLTGTRPAVLAQRALMLLVAAFIVRTGNAVPKRLARLACVHAAPGRIQAFQRLAGWTWVLTGLALGAAWIALRPGAAATATLVVVPAGMAVVVAGWLALRAARGPEPTP